ncbi:MAG: peptidoglycan DD-metalloendopeptidase family protein [Flavobacteriales bacterium]
MRWIHLVWLLAGFGVAWLLLTACERAGAGVSANLDATHIALSYEDSLKNIFRAAPQWQSTGFDFPVGKPDAKNYYNAQAFGENNHLGDDWNGTGGGNSDLGDPVYSISEGVVTESINYFGGWGNVTRVAHAMIGKFKMENGELMRDSTAKDTLFLIESLYAHSQTVMVKRGDFVKRGQQIATIGTAEGKYLAHLHLEIRESAGLPLGGGYSSNTQGHIDPTAFIKRYRKL